MKLCFGTFINVLLLCGVDGIKKGQLINTICKSVDPSCNIPANAVTPLLQCTSNLPDGRSNSLGNVISGAENASPQAVADYFAKKIVTKFIHNDKRKLAVLAIRELIAKDNGIGGSDTVDLVSGKSKNALIIQSIFSLSNFLAGIFLYTAQVNNIVGKEESEKIIMDLVVSFAEFQETISFIVPQKEGEIIGNASEAYIDYLARIKTRYETDKTLLHSKAPTPFYEFWWCIKK